METITNRHTRIIVEAGDIVQTITPMRLASVLCLDKRHISTQREIASILDCTPSTVSQNLKSLSNLPISIVTKDGSKYVITPEGYDIIDAVYTMSDEFGTDIRDVDWSNDDTMDQIETYLEPLHSSRGPLLFFVLHSIGVRNSVGDEIDLLNSSGSVFVSDIVADVQERHSARGESVSRKKVRWQLNKLDETESISFDAKEINLTEKGVIQIQFLKNIIQTVEDINYNESTSTDAVTRSQYSDSSENRTIVSFGTNADTPAIEPTYYCEDDDEPALVISDRMTVNELLDAASRIGQRHSGDTELVLNWTVCEQPEQ